MTFIRSSWYAVGSSEHISRGAPLERTMIEERLVLYRKQDGPPMALCNRRSQPVALLSMGRLGGFTCGYRGEEDRCVQYSHGNGAIPKAAKVQSYPIIDRDGFSWIWMGSPDAASVDLIPDLGPSDVAP